MALTFFHGGTTVTIGEGWVLTTLPDGTEVPAAPNHTPEDIARAHALGYDGDVWAMTRDHDRLHAQLALCLGLLESPALRAAATGQDTEITGAEEEVILAAQRFVNLCRKAGML